MSTNDILLKKNLKKYDIFLKKMLKKMKDAKILKKMKKHEKMPSGTSELCNKKNIFLIDNSNKIKLRHANLGKLHLDQKGSFLFKNTFTK